MTDSKDEITRLLRAWTGGDQGALDRLLPIVYEDLRKLARRRMAGECQQSMLQATALVNEAYVRLVDARYSAWTDRAHFFAVCAKLMRNILVDAARARRARKRGADVTIVELDEALAMAPSASVGPIELDRALEKLSAFDQRKARVIELRIFGGLKVEETAAVLKISNDTVTRDMHLATAWLKRELGRETQVGT